MTEEEKKARKKDYQRKWRELHKDKMYEAHRNDYKKHKQARLEWQHNYYLAKKGSRVTDE